MKSNLINSLLNQYNTNLPGRNHQSGDFDTIAYHRENILAMK